MRTIVSHCVAELPPAGSAGTRASAALAKTVAHMFRLDEDLSSFYSAVREDALVAGVIYALTMPFVAITTVYVYFDRRVAYELGGDVVAGDLPAEIEIAR